MDRQTLNICKITQCPEKFICLHSECINRKQVQCYECISKQHIVGKNKTIKHHDDIVELDKFMKQIKEKCLRREQFLSQLILTSNDFQKEKIQQIELIQHPDVAKVMSEKIEVEIQQFTSILGQESIKLKGYLIYSQDVINFYFDNENTFKDQMRSLYKKLVDKVQSYVLSLNCDIKQQISKLEQRVKCMEVKHQLQLPTVALVLISLVISYFFNQHQNQLYSNKLLDEQLVAYQKNFIEFEQINTLWENKFQIMKEELVSTQDMLEKLKLRFDSFKKNQQNLAIDFQNQINNAEKSINKLHEQQGIIQTSINEKESEILFLKNQTSLFLKNTNNSDILGKINRNISLSRFKDFTLIFDHYFNKYIALSTFDRLSKLATKNNEDTLVCIGALSVTNLQEFILVACDYASEVFQPTNSDTVARKSKNGELYWYALDYFAFGFSPNEKILLRTCDDEDLESELRLSYWFSLRGRMGGRRIGKFNRIENSLDYKLQIYMLR